MTRHLRVILAAFFAMCAPYAALLAWDQWSIWWAVNAVLFTLSAVIWWHVRHD